MSFREQGLDEAENFIDKASATFAKIAEQPGLGSPVLTVNLRLAGLRKRGIARHPNYLVFYINEADAVRIMRVIHVRQDWWALIDIR